jgi:nitroreductase
LIPFLDLLLVQGSTQTVREAILTRRSVRSFTSEPVSLSLLREILSIARYAPSGGNLQPWKVYIVYGKLKADLEEAVRNQLKAGVLSEVGWPVDYLTAYASQKPSISSL